MDLVSKLTDLFGFNFLTSIFFPQPVSSYSFELNVTRAVNFFVDNPYTHNLLCSGTYFDAVEAIVSHRNFFEECDVVGEYWNPNLDVINKSVRQYRKSRGIID